MRLGILGGTFNPVHLGHIRLAEEAIKKLKLNKVIFVPAYESPFAQPGDLASAADRLAMLQAALRPFSLLKVSKYELNKKNISYTIDTIRHFNNKLKKTDRLFFLAGADIALRLNEWKDINEICSLCTFIVARRPGFILDLKLKNVEYMEIDAISISSSQIRRLIKSGKSYKSTVP